MSGEPNSGDLVIGGGGSIAVATDAQYDRVQRIEGFAGAAHAAGAQLGVVLSTLSPAELRAANAPISAFDAQARLDDTIGLLRSAAMAADLTARMTRVSMSVYGLGEAAQSAAMHSLADLVGQLLGRFWPLLLPLAADAVVVAGVAALVEGGPDELLDDIKRLLAEHPELLNNETTVQLIELVTQAIDDVMMGGLQLPGWLVTLLGDSGTGLSGVDTAAAVLVALGLPFGLQVETPVSVTQVQTPLSPALKAAPTGYADRIANLPDTDKTGGAQIRVDRYYRDGRLIGAEVYISGTKEWALSGTRSPFDMTSNTRGIAAIDNGSLRAVQQALQQAGVTGSTPVTFTGHSQGGLLAHELAASGKYNVKGVLEAGPPASQTALSGSVPEVVLAHDEDIVTGLGGSRNNTDAIIVGTTAYPDDPPPKGETVSAHDGHRYQDTAARLDEASNDAVHRAKQSMNATSAGADAMNTTYYKAERVRK